MRRAANLPGCRPSGGLAVPAGGHGRVLAPPPPGSDRAFREFWSASDQNGAAGRIDAILKTGVSFDEALARVRRGRDYSASVPRGTQRGRIRTSNGLLHPYIVVVPENYDPTRTYHVRVQLHGGANRAEPPDQNRMGVDRLPGAVEEIKIFPSAWAESLWWFPSQVENLSKLLDKVKRTYNVDEDHVYLTGTSDGGTGVYFMAFRDTTPWSSFLPLIGNMTVLANPDAETDGEIYPGNAALEAFFVVNAGRDRLYPAHISTHRAYPETSADVFSIYPDSDTTSMVARRHDAFRNSSTITRATRSPTLSWETGRTDRYNRAHWLSSWPGDALDDGCRRNLRSRSRSAFRPADRLVSNGAGGRPASCRGQAYRISSGRRPVIESAAARQSDAISPSPAAVGSGVRLSFRGRGRSG